MPSTAKRKKRERRERHIWLDMMITLLTLELMASFYYGLRAAAMGAVCAAASVLAELVCLRLMHRSFTADDLTCTSDGLILALMLPAVLDYRTAVIACVFTAAVKNLFGGRLSMLFSPAAVAYTFLYTSWKGQLLLFQQPHAAVSIFDRAEELVNSASHTFNLTGRLPYTDFELLMGNFPGSPGAVSILLLLIAAVMLMLRRDISAGAFIGTIAGAVLMSYTVPVSDGLLRSLKYTLCTNMVLFAAVYIVSDRRIAPRRNYYAFFYGFFLSVVSYIVVVTSAKENAIVLVSVLFTPVALGFKNLEKHIDLASEEADRAQADAESAAVGEKGAETDE